MRAISTTLSNIVVVKLLGLKVPRSTNFQVIVGNEDR